MDDSFTPLEQKVHQTVDLVKRLRAENKALAEELRRAQVRVKESEKALEGTDPSPEEERRTLDLTREVQGLRAERDEVRARIAKLVDILDGLD